MNKADQSTMQGGIQALPGGEIPEPQEALLHTVKLYERLAVHAILKRDRKIAIAALMVHPLEQSYPRAKMFVEEYIQAYAAFIGSWE